MSQGPGAPSTRREAIAQERERMNRPRPEQPRPTRPRAAAPRPFRSRRAAVASPHHHRGRLLSRLLAGGILLFVGALVVGLSVPANLLADPNAAAAAPVAAKAGSSHQSLIVDDEGYLIPTTSSDYTASSKAQLLASKYKGGVGGATTGPVRWPFPYQVAILSPFGPRTPPPGCPECSPFHRGTDFAGGNGNPIGAVFSGTVTERTGGSWTYGVYAVIKGQVDGHEITAIYEHMQEDSSPLVVGQHVNVGDFVGLVGETGEATAPHLHLEIDVDGVLTDPVPWLEAHVS